jgi:hypothetical protein
MIALLVPDQRPHRRADANVVARRNANCSIDASLPGRHTRRELLHRNSSGNFGCLELELEISSRFL